MHKQILVFSILGFSMFLRPCLAYAQSQALLLPEPSKLISEFKIPRSVAMEVIRDLAIWH